MDRAMAVLLGLSLAACGGGPLDPTVTEDGLTFFGDAAVVLEDEPRVVATLEVRNDAIRRIERTFDGGCFVERLQVFDPRGGEPRLVWDSADREEPHACTDDLALIDLAPGETAAPPTWGFGVTLAELSEAGVGPGTYAIAIWFRPDEDLQRLGVGEVQVPAIGAS